MMERRRVKAPRVAMGKRFRSLESLRCIGVRTNWEDYPIEDDLTIREAEVLFYPTSLYEDLFLCLGKRVFPRNYYRFMGNKIRQTDLFQLLGISHPRTRLYRGKKRACRILSDFDLPLIAKTAVGSSKGKGVFLVNNEEALAKYLHAHQPAYIQEYLPVDRDLRVVVLGGKAIHAYWRIQRPGEFRNNVYQGATISFSDVPGEAVEFAEHVAGLCRFDEVGLDICLFGDRLYVIEANMVFGIEGFKQAGIDLSAVFAGLDTDGLLSSE